MEKNNLEEAILLVLDLHGDVEITKSTKEIIYYKYDGEDYQVTRSYLKERLTSIASQALQLIKNI